MRRRTVLSIVVGVLVAVPVAGAGESRANKPLASHADGKADVPAEGHKVDFKELFGCEPMGENGHMATVKPASGDVRQEAVQSTQEYDRKQDKH